MADKNNKPVSFITKLFFLIISLVILVISRYAFIFFLLAILPAITALTIDKRINRYAASALCAFNLTGVMPFIFNLFKSPVIDEEARFTLKNSLIWFSIYGSTFLGWLIIWGLPKLTSRIFIARKKLKISNIHKAQSKIIEERGLPTDDK